MRTAEINRETSETKISLTLGLDGPVDYDIHTGVGFLDHMLTGFARHGGFSLRVACAGDTWVDDHHTTEDVGICLGDAFAQALGDMRGINRFGHSILPMDEALMLAAVDLSGRGMLCWDVTLPTEKVGSFDTELVKEFWTAFARRAGCTLHLRQLAGENSHHMIEGLFKAAARSLRQAVALTGTNEIPSTKGMLV
ncbi:MAG: imidazoleglycerol-phosphate dehydratase HisB [Evtepia sp.]|uniref:imidazoleglycerol-phosphate dehydratase HisB n=1 Tax=Evtepia sp. TaxID=2773933 RepID=UPI002A758766|nr:imidazoleglycerol-phosphate dehydratase HisB [Evtepia sp.]MDY3015297.1 imidazoleglycerol-phosphate dehydratase HisB [Evtepia sp.]